MKYILFFIPTLDRRQISFHVIISSFTLHHDQLATKFLLAFFPCITIGPIINPTITNPLSRIVFLLWQKSLPPRRPAIIFPFTFIITFRIFHQRDRFSVSNMAANWISYRHGIHFASMAMYRFRQLFPSYVLFNPVITSINVSPTKFDIFFRFCFFF